MTYFSNRNVNYLNIHLALSGLLDQAYLVFLPLYLYTRGFSIAQVLMLLAGLNALRIPLRLLCLPILHRWGVKVAVMIGAAGYGLSFLLLDKVTGFNGWLLLYALVYGFFNAMHWFSFHLFYTLAGEHEKRGRQVAVAQALTAGFAAFTPLLGAVVIAKSGFQSYFLFAALLVICMLLVLGRCKNIALPRAQWGEAGAVAFNLGARIHVAESAITFLMNICWLFAVYFYVGKITSLGAVVTFGVVVQIVYQLLLGAWVDSGRGTLIVHACSGLRALTAAGRALLPLSLSGILALEAVSAATSVHLNAVEPTVLYNAAKQSSHPVWFWLFAESAYDIGTLIGAGGAALLLGWGMELRHVILFALPFIAVLWQLLHGYFVKNPYVSPSA